AEGLLGERAERRKPALAQRDPCRHGVAAALYQQTVGHRTANRASEIDARNRAARSGAEFAGLERDRKRRAAIPLLEPRRHEPDDAGMPAFRGGHADPALVILTH